MCLPSELLCGHAVIGRTDVAGGQFFRSPLLLLVFLLQLRDHSRIGQGGRVTEGAALGDVAQEAAHDLARAGLGEVGREEDVVGTGEGADLRRDEGA